MNYYEHHIGDYDADTAHLSWVEDMAYTRLIRLYYRKERPIPLDIGEVCRLIRAIGKDQRAAVEAVLREFFVRSDDGWRQARCDEEISRFLSGAPQRKIKKANEENRLKRHREERSELFQALQEHGKHAPWNIGINELRAMVESLHATAPATPATATQTPDPRPHTPEYSVPYGTGGEPPNERPPDPQDQVYAIGIALLTSAEVTEKNARSFLAMQVKAHTAPVVVDALQRCAAEKPIQPVPWLVSALKAKAKRNSRHTGFDQLDYTEGINADGSFT